MKIGVELETRSTQNKQCVLAGKTLQLGSILGNCDVSIYSRDTGVKLKTTRSDQHGRYKAYVPMASAYTIIAIDKYRQFNAVIQDNVVPK
ncbi:hypothetical protein N5B92_00630 [Acinetobacter johnsonii]|uniref:hypothetical protein n=1 Tax=Acinetobacter johnsonii TaxID=40214 RepID=UPI00244CB176|nr:hypothetical protein [Acinetobacter johnsonii]MDH1276150.1 hypothetical protein [Acinetobacter johnsonii]